MKNFIKVILIIFPLLTKFSESQGNLFNNVPLFSKFFVGRTQQIMDIDTKLSKMKFVAITGITGIGKTELARHYALTHENKYDIIGWFDYSKDPSFHFKNFISDLEKEKIYNSRIDLNSFSDFALIKKAFYILKNSRKKILLIFDNVENAEQVKNYLSNARKAGNIKIIITTQNSFGWESDIKLNRFFLKESIEYLKSNLSNRSQEKMEELARMFKGYPLALVQAISYLKEHPTFLIKDYIKLYKSNRKVLWGIEKNFIKSHTSSITDYHTTVDLTFKFTLDQLKNKDPNSYILLCILAFLHNHSFSEENLKEFFIKYSGKTSLEFCEALDSLLAKSLIDRAIVGTSSNNMLAMHDMAQSIVRDILEEQEKRKIITFLGKELEKKFFHHKEDLINYFSLQAEIINDSFSLLENASKYKVETPNLLELKVYLLNYLLYIKRDHTAAKRLINKIEKDKNLSMLKSIILAEYYTDKGDIMSLHYINNPTIFYKVRKEMFKALEILKEYPSYYKGNIRILYNISQNYLLEGDAYTAEKYLLQAQQYLSKVKASNQIHYYYYRSWCAELKGDYKGSKDFSTAALSILDNEPDTPIKFYVYIQIAKSCFAVGENKQAYKYASLAYQKCLQYFASADNDVIAEALITMANTRLTDNNTEDARKFVHRALSAIRKARPLSEDEALCHKIDGDIDVMLKSYQTAGLKYNKAYKIYAQVFKNMKNQQIDNLLFRKVLLGVLSKDEIFVKEAYFQHVEIFGDDRKFKKKVIKCLLEAELPLFNMN